MYLFISTTAPDAASLILVDSNSVLIEKVSLPYLESQRADVLIEVEKLLVNHDVKPKDLTGIVVVTGPGHFSYLRTGIVIANTFAFALNIPVVGIALNDFSNDEELVKRGLVHLKEKNSSVPVMPEYGREPNITTPKK